jgi:hypothetical protein
MLFFVVVLWLFLKKRNNVHFRLFLAIVALDAVELQNNAEHLSLVQHTKIARQSYERLVQVAAKIDVIKHRVDSMNRVSFHFFTFFSMKSTNNFIYYKIKNTNCFYFHLYHNNATTKIDKKKRLTNTKIHVK